MHNALKHQSRQVFGYNGVFEQEGLVPTTCNIKQNVFKIQFYIVFDPEDTQLLYEISFSYWISGITPNVQVSLFFARVKFARFM